MSSSRDTIEAEVLDAAYAKHGGESAWSAFGDGRLNPAEILERIEEGDSSSVAARAVVVGVMLDLVLEGWAKNNDLAKVGENASRLAAASCAAANASSFFACAAANSSFFMSSAFFNSVFNLC